MTKKTVVHIRAPKQALNHGLILKKIQRVIQFNQEAWLKEYIDKNTELRTEANIILRKIFSNKCIILFLKRQQRM